MSGYYYLCIFLTYQIYKKGLKIVYWTRIYSSNLFLIPIFLVLVLGLKSVIIYVLNFGLNLYLIYLYNYLLFLTIGYYNHGRREFKFVFKVFSIRISHCRLLNLIIFL